MATTEDVETASDNESAMEACISQMETDWMPLHDLYRNRFGYEGGEPSRTEMLTVLELAETLIDQHDVCCLIGPDMREVDWTNKKMRDYILSKWQAGEYADVNYGVWFGFPGEAGETGKSP